MFLSDDTCLVQQPQQALNASKGLKVVDGVVQTIRTCFSCAEAGPSRWPTEWRSSCDAGEAVLQDQATLRQGVQVGCLADLVAVSAQLLAVVVNNQNQHVSCVGKNEATIHLLCT